MTLSRTARVLIFILLLAVAAFVWINFFFQRQTDTGETPEVPQIEVAPVGTEVPPVVEGGDGGTPTVVTAPDSPSTVVAPSGPTVVTRDLEVATLPFLVTEPPSESDLAGGDGEGAAGFGPQGRRASINPFSPVRVSIPPTDGSQADTRHHRHRGAARRNRKCAGGP